MDINLIPLAARYELFGHQHARFTRTELEVTVHRDAESFGITDNRGREMGYMYSIDREFWIIDADGTSLVPIEEAEDRLEESFIVYPHGLRDAKAFGPLPVASYKRFRTLDEARTYGAKCIDRAYKRALKKAST